MGTTTRRFVFNWQYVALSALAVACAAVLIYALLPQPKAPASAPGPSVSATPTATVDAVPAASGIPVAAKVFFAGDSLSEGWYATTEAQGFRPLTEAAILAARPAATFSGTYKAGYTVQQVGDSFEIPTGNDVAVIELGTNDVLKGTDPALFAEQYAAYVAAVKTANPAAALTCLGSFYFESPQSIAVDRAVKAACEKNGGRYVDLTATYVAAGTRGPEFTATWLGPSDMGHPNDAGHQAIADLVLAGIPL